MIPRHWRPLTDALLLLPQAFQATATDEDLADLAVWWRDPWEQRNVERASGDPHRFARDRHRQAMLWEWCGSRGYDIAGMCAAAERAA